MALQVAWLAPPAWRNRPSRITATGMVQKRVRSFGWRPRLVRLGRLVRSHGILLGLLVVGLLLRAGVTLAYRPALMLYGDSYDYLRRAYSLHPGPFHPLGYSVFLRLLVWTDDLRSVVVVQHLLGVALGVGTYLLLLRLGVRRWLAALAAAPVLLDAYQAGVEQFVLAETLFEVLLLGGLALLFGRRLSPGRAAASGVLLAAATLTRSVAGAVVAMVVVLVVIRRVGWRPTLALTAGALLPLLAYAAWFDSITHSFRLTAYDGRFLYGKVAPIARCDQVELPAALRGLCPAEDIGARRTSGYYIWNGTSPFYSFRPRAGQGRDEAAQEWALRVIAAEPADYAGRVGSDLVRYFSPTRSTRPGDWHVQSWEFVSEVRPARWHTVFAPVQPRAGARYPDILRIAPRPAHPPASVLHAYQRVGYIPGPAVGLCVVLALAGAALGRRSAGAPQRWACVVLASSGILLIAGSAATVPLDYRYLLPAVVLLAPAGLLGTELLLTRWLPGGRGAGPGSTALLRRPAR